MSLGSYTVNQIGASISAAAPKTMIQVLPPAGHAVDVLESAMGNEGTSLVSAMLEMQIITYTTAGTVTAFLPIALNAGGAASACVSGTASTGITASAEGTTAITIMVAENFNVLSSWRYEPIPERRPRIGPAVFVALRYSTTPAATMTTDCQLQYYELL